MAKVFGIHEIETNPGINEDGFKRFFIDEFAPMWAGAGWKLSLLQGDRGERAGKYAVLFEIESVEARNRFSPAPNTNSEESDRYYEAHKAEIDAIGAKYLQFSPTDLGVHPDYTDYIVLE
jgi:hypothetical protein